MIRLPEVKSLPLVGDIYGLENVVFVLATGETNSAAHIRLVTYLKAHQAAYFPTAKLVDDTLALRMDLSAHHLFVIGTPWGNRFYNTYYPNHPFDSRHRKWWRVSLIPVMGIALCQAGSTRPIHKT